jgi:hypothetical protein
MIFAVTEFLVNSMPTYDIIWTFFGCLLLSFWIFFSRIKTKQYPFKVYIKPLKKCGF